MFIGRIENCAKKVGESHANQNLKMTGITVDEQNPNVRIPNSAKIRMHGNLEFGQGGCMSNIWNPN